MTDKKKKVNKSVSLNPDVYDRLVVICERLGVNVNAYLVNAVGQQIQRDEAPILAQEVAIKSMMSIFEGHIETEQFNEQTEKVAVKLAEAVSGNKKP